MWVVACAAQAVLGKREEATKDRQCFRGALIYGLDHYAWQGKGRAVFVPKDCAINRPVGTNDGSRGLQPTDGTAGWPVA